MAIKYTPPTKPSRGGLLKSLIGVGLDLAASAGSSVKQAAAAANAGQVVHKPCDVCTAPAAPVNP